MSFEVATDCMRDWKKNLLRRRDQIFVRLDNSDIASDNPNKKEFDEINRQINELDLATSILTNRYDGIRNFIINIQPVMIKVKEGVEISSEERNKIIQFYTEVANQTLSMGV